MSLLLVTTIGLTLFGGSTIVVAVLIWRAPLRNDFDDRELPTWSDFESDADQPSLQAMRSDRRESLPR